MCCALLGVKEKVKGKTVKEKNNIKTKAKTHQPSEKKEEGIPAAWNPTPQRQITRTVFPSSSLCLFYEHILQLMLSCSLLSTQSQPFVINTCNSKGFAGLMGWSSSQQ